MSTKMITINLLPPEELKAVKFRQRRLPIIPVIFIIFLISFLMWAISMTSLLNSKNDLSEANIRESVMREKRKEVDQIWNRVHGDLEIKKSFGEKYMLRKIEWAQIFSILSENLRPSIWLTSLSIEKKDGNWLVSLSGFSKPLTGRSMIQEIGNYVSDVKEELDAIIMARLKNAQKAATEFVEESTTTNRKQAEKIELTEFITTFKIKL